MIINRSADLAHHIYKLQAIPLDWLTEERLKDLSWLLDDGSIRQSCVSLMVLPPVLLVFLDSPARPLGSSFELTTMHIH